MKNNSIDTKIVNCWFSNSVDNDVFFAVNANVDNVTVCGNSFISQDATHYAVYADPDSTAKNIIVTNNIMATRRANLTAATSTVIANNIEV